MISILKNTSNTVDFTLFERQTIFPAGFVFRFEHDQTGEVKQFTTEDLTFFPERYNRFVIQETTSEDLHIGKVSLKIGYHHYQVFEVELTSPPSIVTGSPELLLEEGKVLVTDLSETQQSVYTANDGGQNNVYQ